MIEGDGGTLDLGILVGADVADDSDAERLGSEVDDWLGARANELATAEAGVEADRDCEGELVGRARALQPTSMMVTPITTLNRALKPTIEADLGRDAGLNQASSF